MTKRDERAPPIELTEEKLTRLAEALDREGIVSARPVRLAGEPGRRARIDVGAHLVGELVLKPPHDYRGIFESLRAAGLDAVLAGHLADSAGIRKPARASSWTRRRPGPHWGGWTTCAPSPPGSPAWRMRDFGRLTPCSCGELSVHH